MGDNNERALRVMSSVSMEAPPAVVPRNVGLPFSGVQLHLHMTNVLPPGFKKKKKKKTSMIESEPGFSFYPWHIPVKYAHLQLGCG